MNLYLLRHAKARSKSHSGQDRDRALTPQGKASAFKKAMKWKKTLTDVEVIVTSPARRCLETAEIFASVLNKMESILEDETLDVTARAEDVLKSLRKYSHHRDLLIIGHEPWMSALASLLFTGTSLGQIRLKKTGLIVLNVGVLAPRGGILFGLK